MLRDQPSNLPSAPRPGPSTPGGRSRAAEHSVQDYQEQLRKLASQLSLTEARERREIASDLHDHIGQALAYVSQKVSTMRGNSIFSGMDDQFSDILSILGKTIRYTRDLTVEISPPILYELGLPAAIDWQAERAATKYGLAVKSRQSGEPATIAEDVSVFVFKAVQELIHNVAKHASASRVDIASSWKDDHFKIVVSDDGRGFDTASLSTTQSRECFGIFSIRERLSFIGGTLTITSAPGSGTRVALEAPYTTREEAGRD